MSVTHEGVTFEHPGHATVRIETREGTVLYIDPWSQVLDGSPRDGDVVFVTHDDFDHYDPDGIDAVATSDAAIAVYEAVDTEELDRPVTALPADGTASVAGIDVRTVPGFNDPDGDHVTDAGEPYHEEGEVIGLVLELQGLAVFYPSDTDFLPHHESIEADVFVPPIGGHYTMDRHEAARFARSVGPELVLPVHYDTFEAIETDVKAFVDELAADDIRTEIF